MSKETDFYDEYAAYTFGIGIGVPRGLDDLTDDNGTTIEQLEIDRIKEQNRHFGVMAEALAEMEKGQA